MQAYTGEPSAWNSLIARLPDPHLLQTWEWAKIKAAYGWIPAPFIWKDEKGTIVAAAMVLKRMVLSRGFSARLCILYIPKGPLLDWSDEPLRRRVLDNLQSFAKKQGAIFLKIDPDVVIGRGIEKAQEIPDEIAGEPIISDLKRRGWLFSSDQIQFRNTVTLDLSVSEADILGRMKQKTRYNVRLAEKKGVKVRTGSQLDLPLLYKMYAETSVRDGFVIRDEGYYRKVWETFLGLTEPGAEVLVAEVDGEPVAAIFVFYFAGRAYYIYGMSRDMHREKMPSYLLQWEAIKRAKTHGSIVYDLWGAPDVFDGNDALWGVFRFKEGLGGEVVRTIGAWDFTASSFWYKIYTQIIPRLLDIMRLHGRFKTKQIVGGA